jgi:hypothetical protein
VLRQRLLRRIESLPEAQVYQVLDYIEFLESKYAREAQVEASGLQKLAEGLQDKMRKKAMNPDTIREAFQLIAAADRVLSGVSSAGRQILNELGTLTEPVDERRTVPPAGGAGSRGPSATSGGAGSSTSERRGPEPPATRRQGGGIGGGSGA